MICPKCGFEQPEGSECMRCGVIFSKVRTSVERGGAQPPVPPVGAAVGGSAATAAPPPPPTGTATPLPPMVVGGGTFEVGGLLGDTFRTFFQNLIPFMVIATIALSPMLGAWAWLGSVLGRETMDPQLMVMALLVFALGSVFAAPIATAAITFGVVQALRGQIPSLGDSLGRGLSVMLPVLGVAILQGLAVGAGFLLCIIPGIIVAMIFAVAVPAAVEERPGVFAALQRSSELTRGYRWQIFGVLFVLGLLQRGLDLAVESTLGGGGAAPSGEYMVVSGLLMVFSTALSATAAAVMYYRLRSVKESVDIESITSVFD